MQYWTIWGKIGAEATNFLTKELLKKQAQTEGLGNLIELTKKGETYLKKYKEIIDKAPLIAPSQAILEIMKKESCVFGLQNPIVLAEKGEDNKAEELMTTSFEFLLGDSKDFLNFLQQERELFCLTLGVLVEYGKRR